MTRERSRWHTGALLVVLAVLAGCGGADDDPVTPSPSATSPTQSAPTEAKPTTTPTKKRPKPAAESTATPPSGLVYYAGRRARTGELLLFAEQTGFAGRTELLAAVRAAMAGAPVDPDYTSLWDGNLADSVRLHWDGDEGFYSVRLLDDSANTRPAGMSLREAHLAIQQVVWTLHSVGEISAPVQFRVGDSHESLTQLLGVPATGPYGAYLAADYTGVLSSMNILTPDEGAVVDGVVEVSGLAESFEATVAVRVFAPNGEIVHDYSTQAAECCGALFPFSYSLDTTGWPPGDYTLKCLTDDPLGIEQGSDGPDIDTKTITVR